MTVLITLTTAGISTGPFNLYSNVDGYAVPFESSVPKASLVLGYTSVLVPTGTTTVQVKSLGTCTTGVNILIGGVTTTTAIPTTTIAPTTMVPTTTVAPIVNTTTVAPITTTTLCAGSTPHPYPAILVFGIDLNNFSGSLVDACQAAACLQAGTCNTTGIAPGNFNDAIPVIGGGFYATTIGECTPPSTTGYHVINLSGTYTVIQMLNGYVQSYPTCEPTTTTVSPLPPGAELFVVTQGYTTAQLACNNYTNNSGNTGGVGTAGQIYVAGNMAYNANGTPFVGNPALFYIITPYINITPGLESTCHISALGVVTGGGTLDCLTINIP